MISNKLFRISLNAYWRPLFYLTQRLQFLRYRKKAGSQFRMVSGYALFQTSSSYERPVHRWIESLAAGKVLWDIGSNIGIHAVIAGRRGVTTYAFEPGAGNFYELVRNISQNDVNATVIPVPFALSNKQGIDFLYLNTVAAGSSWNNLGEATTYGQGRADQKMFRQMVYTTSIDDLVAAGFPAPSYLKVDVDGLEPLILEGATRTLASSRIEMVMLEMAARTKPKHAQMYEQLRSSGYTPFVSSEEDGPWRDVLWLHDDARMPEALTSSFQELPDLALLLAR